MRTSPLLPAVVVAAAVASGCSDRAPRAPSPQRLDAHTVELGSIVPQDADIVARADLSRARAQGAFDDVLAWLRGASMSDALLDTVQPCLEQASDATIALRLGPHGLDGDTLLRIRVPGDSATGVPCGASGWKRTGSSGGVEVFEPELAERRRTAPAMMFRDRSGNVLVATAGQLDTVLRLIRQGPDADALEPPTDSMVGVAARIDEAQLPATWREASPTLTELARGLSRMDLRVDAGDKVDVRASIHYADSSFAQLASEKLRRVHDALLGSDREALRRAAQLAHAARHGDEVRLELSLPRER